MGRKFEEYLEMMDYNELMRLKGDLDNRGLITKKTVEATIKHKLSEHNKTCAVCSAELNFYTSNNYTLVFGPHDFRKKASFCGLDCLENFTTKLKELHREYLKQKCEQEAEK